ncbi:hypothetical protein, partial [Rhizobium sp. CF142]|uniref:hypothetical protein n=1 Tax=Rhizobium sp. CF142 TaxID=1144314 RepID=UPI001AEC4219
TQTARQIQLPRLRIIRKVVDEIPRFQSVNLDITKDLIALSDPPPPYAAGERHQSSQPVPGDQQTTGTGEE